MYSRRLGDGYRPYCGVEEGLWAEDGPHHEVHHMYATRTATKCNRYTLQQGVHDNKMSLSGCIDTTANTAKYHSGYRYMGEHSSTDRQQAAYGHIVRGHPYKGGVPVQRRYGSLEAAVEEALPSQ